MSEKIPKFPYYSLLSHFEPFLIGGALTIGYRESDSGRRELELEV